MPSCCTQGAFLTHTLHESWSHAAPATSSCVPSFFHDVTVAPLLQPSMGLNTLQRRLQDQRQHMQVPCSITRHTPAPVPLTASRLMPTRSELAELDRPRIIVLDTTFAHHSWDFEPQVSFAPPLPSLSLVCLMPCSCGLLLRWQIV